MKLVSKKKEKKDYKSYRYKSKRQSSEDISKNQSKIISIPLASSFINQPDLKININNNYSKN